MFEFKSPSHIERRQIWSLVTAHEAIPCADGIDWDGISLQYELTGGFIKNAVMSALLTAVGRDATSPLITEEDITQGCRKQMRGALHMLDFEERVVPESALNELITADSTMESLREIVSMEKARSVLFSQWGFDRVGGNMRARQGTTALFWGLTGTGRSSAAEAVGFEMGKPLKVVDLPGLLWEESSRGHEKKAVTMVREIFSEARLMDAVLVLDGYELDIGAGAGVGSGGQEQSTIMNLVIREMARFPGVVIMMLTTSASLDVFVSRLDKALVRGLKFIVEFQLPNLKARKKLWRSSLPPDCPTSGDVDWDSLAAASDKFSHEQISNVVYRAAAKAALRPSAEGQALSQADLEAALKVEKTRGESEVDRMVRAQYM